MAGVVSRGTNGRGFDASWVSVSSADILALESGERVACRIVSSSVVGSMLQSLILVRCLGEREARRVAPSFGSTSFEKTRPLTPRVATSLSRATRRGRREAKGEIEGYT